MRPGTTEILIVLLIIVLLFGASRLPKLARSLREARHEFEKGVDEPAAPSQATPQSQAQPAPRNEEHEPRS